MLTALTYTDIALHHTVKREREKEAMNNYIHEILENREIVSDKFPAQSQPSKS